jgi:hypothetical protein
MVTVKKIIIINKNIMDFSEHIEPSKIMNYCFEYDINGITARFFADGHSEEEAWEKLQSQNINPNTAKIVSVFDDYEMNPKHIDGTNLEEY